MTGAQALRHNVSETYLALAGGIPDTHIVRSPAYWLCTSSFEHPIANLAVRLDLSPRDADELAHEARENPVLRIYVLPEDEPPHLRDMLRERNLADVHRLTGMVLEQAPTKAEEVARRAEGPALDRAIRFIIDNFFWSTPGGTRDRLVEAVRSAVGVPHEFYVIEDDAGVLSAATLTLTGEVAGLYNVCVRPAERGRGIGSKVVLQLASAVRRRGLHLVLQCEPSLAAWYGGLGFESVGEAGVFVAALRP
ncbi:MAG: GNAT family N-acetyltransferase [Armatimonadetes bacterium]|nr:GNAT family N-acetyltransferase [Armatimonadota bacterium]